MEETQCSLLGALQNKLSEARASLPGRTVSAAATRPHAVRLHFQLLLWLKERAPLLAAFGNPHYNSIIRPPLASVLENPLWTAFGPVLNMLSESWKSRTVELPPPPSYPTSALPIPQSQMADI